MMGSEAGGRAWATGLPTVYPLVATDVFIYLESHDWIKAGADIIPITAGR
jgi:hypothetical protein